MSDEPYEAAARAYCLAKYDYTPEVYVQGQTGADEHLTRDAADTAAEDWLRAVVDAAVASLTAELEQMKQVVAAARSVFEVEHRRAEKAEAERDRLREEVAEYDKKWDLVIDQIATASARVMRERDAALASRDTAYRALDEAERNLSAALGSAEGNLPQLVEQTARMRAVVEAARAVATGDIVSHSRVIALVAAVDVLDAGAATGRARFFTDPCVAGQHDKCQGAEDGSSVYPGDVYLCVCPCHGEDRTDG
jgi:hypothetical protein